MKIKDKIKSYSFWVSLASAVILILKVVGSRFGFTVDESMVSDAFTALCSILVLLGIIVVPSTQDKTSQTQESTELTQLSNQSNELKNEIKDPAQTFKAEENSQEPNLNNEANQENKLNSDNEIVQVETSTQNLITANLTQPQFKADVEITTNLETKNQDEVQAAEVQTIDQETEAQISAQEIPEITIQEVTVQDFSESKSHEITEEIDNCVQSEEQVFNKSLSNEANQASTCEERNIVEDLKNLLTSEREKFANNINDYILELQEELRKARERM